MRAPLHGLCDLVATASVRLRSSWQPTPVVVILGADGEAALTAVNAWLAQAGREPGRRPRGVPHALVAAGPGQVSVRQLLVQATQLLDAPVGGRPLHLRRYDLTRLLLTDPPPRTASRHVMRRWLRQQLAAMYAWYGPAPGMASQSGPWWVTLALWAASRFTPSLRSIREVRWLLHQPYLDGALSHSLDHFVRFLTHESTTRPDEVDALLVHALLSDLRAEYRSPWGRRGGRSRTALPVLLLPAADPGTPAGQLMDLVIRVRRDTGDDDPLLVLAQSTDPTTDGRAAPSATAAQSALAAWRVERSVAGAVLPAALAVLPLQLADPAPAPTVPPAPPPPLMPPAPPWWARRAVLPALLAATVLVGAGSLALTWQPGLAAGCWSAPIQVPGAPSGSAVFDAVTLREGQCIGVSDRTVFGRGAEQNRVIVQEAIHEQNAALDPGRTILTIVYLEQLTGPDDLLITPTQQAIQFGSEVEDLQGLWAAQVRARDLRSGPQLRVVIANAGRGMQHIGEVTDRILELRRRDPSLVAVIGGGESNRATETAVERLSAAGLVFVAPILTTDRFAPTAANYLQLSRPNADQARLMTSYLAARPAPTPASPTPAGSPSPPPASPRRIDVTAVAYTDIEQDRYVQTLTADVVAWSRSVGTAKAVDQDDDLGLADACESGTALAYTGRWHLFNDFLGRLDQLPHTACNGLRPLVVAGDSVSAWVTSPFQRTLPAVRVPSIVYASNGVYCATLDRTGDGEVLLSVLRRRSPTLCRRPPTTPGGAATSTGTAGTGTAGTGTAGAARTATIGERQALAWDAALMVRSAVVTLQGRQGNQGGQGGPNGTQPLPTAASIVELLGDQGYSGAGGRYDFVDRIAQRNLSLVCLPAPDASRVTVWTWDQMVAGAPIGRCSAPAAS